MITLCPRPFPVRIALASALLAAGCAISPGSQAPPAPAGFSADTFTREGLVSGATATEVGCRALPDALWVETSGRRECLRYAAGGAAGPSPVALLHLPGDPPGIGYRVAGGRVQVDRVSEFYEQDAGSRRLAARILAGTMQNMPVFLIARPGMHGSSGNHAQDRHTLDEVELVDGAVGMLKRRYGFRDAVLSGFSSGGLLVANLLARRSDIRCAVIASAPLDLAQFHSRPDGIVADDFALRMPDLADPMRSVATIRSNAEIFVIGDRRDRSVPHAAWIGWSAAARRKGLRVHDAQTNGLDRAELGPVRTYHITSGRSLEAAYGCATGWPPERLRQALLGGERILRPAGQRLDGAAIRAAFTGRQLSGVDWNRWGMRATLSTFWSTDGKQYQFHSAHLDRRLVTQQWWIDSDTLCTSDDGCNAVLFDGQALHLVGDEPRRFQMSFTADAPGH
ncbi:hypothetical protein JMJ56_14435 [Belnapia sp. T18]|uniref:Peptidase S9 prolyl oligopeptidase catalytic domain-containing protein n=1 Tax=Belnapia arida TaxID=2804533 RepID=A0ABS1U3F8_9PROT|nr:hypothetical protein [Belnapia arida]MBL6079213.1 hypothetical protein [Belnapia arida]